ncbi:MAG: isoprenylcysteine carboxylmethyltransferase family protein [Scytonema sp. PMC 1069.18]|nr:isoprenylcysteine carboxylmethyltransferase family protein [Scytonema sp. PMC 1069.18]MEC4882111.1 isoprenylcysteine carboxylmethyltransferase family protein [Scytonema sp. PMC 1070.18]
MVTKVIFTAIVVGVFIQRLLELSISKRHVQSLLSQGGRLHGENYLWLVKVLQIAWFAAMIAEVWLLQRPFIPVLAAIALFGAVVGQVLRYLSMSALGERWTLPLITIPGTPIVDFGIYSHLRHPNWLGVIIEIFSVPLIHTAFLTAIFFSICNAVIMSVRVQAEEYALSADNNYASVFANHPRFIPYMRLIRVRKKEITK